MMLPTGKAHISFSEIKLWAECSYRHKLTYVDKLDAYQDNQYADFGTICHNHIEIFLKSKKPISEDQVIIDFKNMWKERRYDSDEFILEKKESDKKYKHVYLETWVKYALQILSEFPEWMNSTFPDYQVLSVEELLMEDIEGHDQKFKGFIDCIIKVPKKNDKYLYYIIDWKTTGPGGWFYLKKRDFNSLAQIGMYKLFWSKKYEDINVKDIRTAFVFLKRGAKPGKCIDIFTVSTGPKFLEKSSKLINTMLYNVKKGVALRNYSNCKFCPFKNTEHCSGGEYT